MRKYFWYAFVLALPIGLRLKLYPAGDAFFEYASVFLYPLDLAALLFVGYCFWRKVKLKTGAEKLYLATFLAISLLAMFVAPFSRLALVGFLRLALFSAVALYGAEFLAQKKVFKTTCILLAVLAGLEGFLGSAQFLLQRPVGLSWLGEPPLSLAVPGSGKILTPAGPRLRATGTFSHPNVYAGFLTLGILCLAQLFISLDRSLYKGRRRYSLKNLEKVFNQPAFFWRMALVVGLAGSLFGLLTSFSRSGWLATTLSLAALLTFSLQASARPTLRFLGVFLISGLFLGATLLPFLTTRLNQNPQTDPALLARQDYNSLGISLVGAYSLGLGPQISTVFSATSGLYNDFGFSSPWEWQPIHNLYLLIAADVGIFGLLSFLIFLVMVMRGLKQKFNTPENLLCASWLLAILILGLFDHYLWTLEAGIGMFWLIIALSLSRNIIRPR